ncbi:hypothetical protein [Aestuariivirga sp.]|uniref:hypothetical protein n=1 Tax=Aestuariivirga sp. TaxID=2650926 RepID=UPI0039E4C10C
MKWLAAIAVALALAGCTDANSPLQQDLRRLAELPKRMDTLGRRDVSATPPAVAQPADPAVTSNRSLAAGAPATTATTAPAVQSLATPPDQQVATLAPPPVEPVQAEQQAAAEAPAPPPAQQVAAAEASPAPAPKLTLLDRLRAATSKKQAAPVTPNPQDQIPDPIPVENPLARPPWEVFVEAGPNAHNELDLETLYGPGNIPPELMAEQQAAEQQADAATPPMDTAAATPPADDPAKKPAKPGAVTIKAVAVPSVKGATGSGNKELTIAMRDALQQAGWPILTAARGDALTVQGRVVIGEAHGATQSVKIVWDVLTPDGKNLGNLKQDNAVPAGSLDKEWGDNARYAAEAAAEGIFSLIQKYR